METEKIVLLLISFCICFFILLFSCWTAVGQQQVIHTTLKELATLNLQSITNIQGQHITRFTPNCRCLFACLLVSSASRAASWTTRGLFVFTVLAPEL